MTAGRLEQCDGSTTTRKRTYLVAHYRLLERCVCVVDRWRFRARTSVGTRACCVVLPALALATACTTARSSAVREEAQGQGGVPTAISESFRRFSFDSTVEYACIGHRSQLPADTLSVEILLGDENSASSRVTNITYVRTPVRNQDPVLSFRLETIGKAGAVGGGCGAKGATIRTTPARLSELALTFTAWIPIRVSVRDSTWRALVSQVFTTETMRPVRLTWE